MRKLFWAIQNLTHIGGSETVSVKLMNLLCSDYEVHLICTSEIEGGISYDIDPRIQIHCLGIPSEVARSDQAMATYAKKFQIFKIVRLIHRIAKAYFYKRGKYRKLIGSWMDNDSIYVGSQLDSYLFAPKKGDVYFHYHLNSANFFFWVNQWGFRRAVKPKKYVFLAQDTINAVLSKKPKLKDVSTYIYNPVRFSPVEDYAYHGNKILFVGRFTEQKDPLLALEIAKKLHEDGFPFTLTMIGEGHFEPQIKEFIQANGLSEVSVKTDYRATQDDFSSNDLLLCTSRFEGFPLIYGEANSCSLPIVTSRWDGAVEESFVKGKSGWIIEGRNPADYAAKIEEVLSDKKVLEKSRRNALEAAKRLSDENIARQWKDLFEGKK